MIMSVLISKWREPMIRTQRRKPSKTLLEILSANLREYRRIRGFSQEELAEMCGLHRTYVGSVERQERNVTLSTLEALATALGISAPELLSPHSRKGK